MLSSSFLLFLALTSVRSEVIDINTGSDHILILMNQLIHALNETTTKIPAGKISFGNDSISYSEGTLVGLDSMVRTGNCIMKKEPSSISFEVHFGYSLLTAFFGNIMYKGESMSAFFRIGNNSLRLTFNVRNGNGCHFLLDSINYERMSKIVMGTSMPELDGQNVDTFFQQYVIPEMDKKLNAHKVSIENSLQLLCKLIPGDNFF